MNIITTEIPDLFIVEPRFFADDRGWFFESYQKERYQQLGIKAEFVQDNISKSKAGTLRGLHYQLSPFQQAKLVQVLEGEVYDVAVDLRKNSPTFGKHHGVILSEQNRKQFFIPAGFAHGFCVLSDSAVFHYKCDNVYSPDHERGILWSDPELGIKWPISAPILSSKDKTNPTLGEISEIDLPIQELE